MKPSWTCLLVGSAIFVAAEFFTANAGGDTVATAPVYVPSTSHQNDPMPDGVLAWNNVTLETNMPSDAYQAHFLFTFTNIFRAAENSYATNKTAVTNDLKPAPVSIFSAHASCGCTQPQLPPLPWTVPPDGTGQIPVTVNVAGKSGSFIKSIHLVTDRGYKDLFLRINMMQPMARTMTEAERQQGIAAAKIDRMAVFKGDCATCHVKNGDGKYGMMLFQADCAICHEAENRASFVPDLHKLKVPTNQDFWRTWISHGKPGSFMPAFSESDGGPLSDLQIASLAVYLDQAIPSHIPPAPQ